MKTFLLLVLLTCSAFGQLDKPEGVKPEELTAEESNVLGQMTLLNLRTERCALLGSADKECKDASSKLATLYTFVSKSPRLIRYLSAEAVLKYQQMESGAKSAMQASQIVDQQNAKLIPLLVLQNQRIIELLEQLVKKPK